ncbi:putative Zn-finger protein [Chitinivorax tropicus]|uniref:Putative Zn-finger protein n=1 Tax=Chitinivorax tropicus TaxID=714531 RepID=A0A840MU41_9PROT|nr:zinc-finger domain-containing protein [Chitinivorax tropicus]MBB5019886.1 putative Zn-finger protein [Chitinivorax tropicus]
MAETKELSQRIIEVSDQDLPLHCPMPDMLKWNAHPRVFLAIEKTGEAKCPYCGTDYKLKGGPRQGGHH